jgi:hypothetical protein
MNWESPYRPIDTDRRRFLRVPLACEVHYDIAGTGPGHTRSENVSRGGLSLRLREPAETGAPSLLAIGRPGGWAELKARVTWRHHAGDGEYLAGLRVYHDEPEVLDVMSWLVHQGMLHRLGKPDSESQEPVSAPLRSEAGIRPARAAAVQVA